MDIEIREFITYLHNTKKTSANTEISYQRDLKKMAEFLKERGIRNYKDVKELELEGYISYMEREKFASSSISRSVASMRAFFQYLWKEGVIAEDPADNLKPPKVEKRAPEILTIEEVDKLLQQPKLDTPKGIRDSAMLELLYATGMRVSEMLHLQIFDVNLRQHFYNREIIHESAMRCNVLKINDEELVEIGKIFGWSELSMKETCLKLLADYNLKILILTCGVNGSYVFEKEPVSFVLTPRVEVADTVGAGDSFTAAFVAAMLKGMPVKQAHQLAVDVSAFVCTQHGAMPVLPEQLKSLCR